MTEKRPAIEITIERSTVHGDVVAGNKTVVNVHLHPDQLSSAEAIERALAEQHGAGEADELIQRLLSDPDLLARLDTARRNKNQKDVARELDEIIREYERRGGSDDLVKRLRTTVDSSRALADWASFVRAASGYLAITYNRPEDGAATIALADEIVAVASKDPVLADYVPIARICQARLLYLQYTIDALELRTALGIRSNMKLQAPLFHLVEEHQQTLGYLALADEYAREAIDVAFDRGNAGVVIFTLFGVIALQEHAHFHHRYAMERDAHDLAERVRRAYRILEQIIDRFGSASDMALLQSNLANFWRQTGEYEKAEVVATSAAKALAGLGDAHGAHRALEVAQLARVRTPVARRPTDEDIAALTAEQVEAMVREASKRLLQLHHVDQTDPALQEAIALAWADFNPERVLRYCEHIVLSNQTSPLGELVAIPTLGTKQITCEKFERALQSPSLDRGFEAFKLQLKCEACPHRTPRLLEWKWHPAKQ